MVTSQSSSPGQRRFQLVCVIVGVMALPAGWALYHYPPDEGSYYPRCFFFVLTGLHCPGCGATRCAYALLHGQFLQAAAYNSFALLLVPVLAFAGVRRAYRALTGQPATGRRLPAWSIWLLFFLIVAYAILRNIDVYPFSLLAPHEL
jgi:hypothetical protein